jgi:hypothetical protein
MSESKYHRLTDIKEVKNDGQLDERKLEIRPVIYENQPQSVGSSNREKVTSVNSILISLVTLMALLLSLNIVTLIAELFYSSSQFSLSYSYLSEKCSNMGTIVLINAGFISHDINLLLQLNQGMERRRSIVFIYINLFLRIAITFCIYVIFFNSVQPCFSGQQSFNWLWITHMINIGYNCLFTLLVILNSFIIIFS